MAKIIESRRKELVSSSGRSSVSLTGRGGLYGLVKVDKLIEEWIIPQLVEDWIAEQSEEAEGPDTDDNREHS